MANPKPASGSSEEDPSFSTLEFIAEARRPLLIERHRQLVEEMESSLAEAFITGEADNPRLKAMLAELDSDSETARVGRTVRTIAEDPHYRDGALRRALIEELCLLREQGGIEIATLQMHVIGVYRAVRARLVAAQGEPPALADLRELPVPMLGRLLNPIAEGFGSSRLGDALAYTPAFAERALRAIRRLRLADGADRTRADAAGEPRLSREQEEPLAALPEAERQQARQLLVRDRIRSRFYREVFLVYLSESELDPREIEAHPTVLHWLESIEATAHLYRFMQGQTTQQKAFRLGQLLQKVVQLHEMYARVALASQHPSYRESFVGLNTRDRLALMAKDHYPPLALSSELTLAALLCPFAEFVRWVQEKVQKQDFVLPPDPKR